MPASVLVTDPFASVFGRGRGIDLSLWREREFVDLGARLSACDDEEATALFYRHRGNNNSAAAEVANAFAQRLAENTWFRWWHQSLDDALTALGLGVHNHSPWLLSEEVVGTSFKRIIHLTDIQFDAEWHPLPDARNGYGVAVSLCGKNKSALDNDLNHKGFHHLPRGLWQASLSEGARRRGIRGIVCNHCLRLHEGMGLAIPAVFEDRSAGPRAGQKVHSNYNEREFTRKTSPGLVAFTSLANTLLGTGDRQIVSTLDAHARSYVCSRLAAAISTDPIPVLMHVLSPRERSRLCAHAQTRVQTHLQTLNWEGALSACLQPQPELGRVQTLLRQAVTEL
jgi:hypothetical protein